MKENSRRLEHRKQTLFNQKQAAFARYISLREQTDRAFAEKKLAWSQFNYSSRMLKSRFNKKGNRAAFRQAKSAFDSAKAWHKQAEARFLELKKDRDAAKKEFDLLQERYQQVRTEIVSNNEFIKQNRLEQAIRIVNLAMLKSGVKYDGNLTGKNVKVVPHSDGTTHVYFGGLNKAGDGPGHGHAVIDHRGEVIYLRDAWQRHDEALIRRQNNKNSNSSH